MLSRASLQQGTVYNFFLKEQGDVSLAFLGPRDGCVPLEVSPQSESNWERVCVSAGHLGGLRVEAAGSRGE